MSNTISIEKLFEHYSNNPIHFVELVLEEDNGSGLNITPFLHEFNQHEFTEKYFLFTNQQKEHIAKLILARFNEAFIAKHPALQNEVFWLRDVFYMVNEKCYELKNNEERKVIDANFLKPVDDILQRLRLAPIE